MKGRGEGIRSCVQLIQNGRVVVCLFVGGRPGCSFQTLDVSRGLPKVINGFRVLKGVAHRSKSRGDNVNALLLLESFQYVFKKLNPIARPWVTPKEKKKVYTGDFKYLYVINLGPKTKQKDRETSIFRIQNGR